MSATSDKLKEFTAEVERDNPGWAKEARERSLGLVVIYCEAELCWLDVYDNDIRERFPADQQDVALLFNKKWRQLLKKQLKRTEDALMAIQNGTEKDRLTDAEIAHARQYPIERLVKVNKAWNAHCISGTHADEKPSMYCKNNFAHCFSCGWSGDTIAIARVLYDISFAEAVRRLQ